MTNSIIVQNLKCSGCATTITTKLSALDDVNSVVVDKDSSTITFEHTNKETEQVVKDKLQSLGYPTVGDANNITSKAKSFISCASGKMKK